MRKINIAIFASLFAFFGTNANALNLPTEASGNPSAFCKEEWSKRGILDTNMYNYCMNLQHEGYLNFVDLARKYSNQPWIQTAIDYSLQEWTKRGVRQDQMVHFSLDRITDGYEDLVYLSKRPGWNGAKYKSCYAQWGFQYDMVLYCYKN